MEPTLSELFQNGLQLMVVGMSIVFLFLALLVGAVSLLPNLLRRFDGEQNFEQTTLAASTAKHREQAAVVDADTQVAIRTAIQLYESNK
ncbi:MAG TPA: OadG family protein [Methylococcaceae bacterium]|nr:OadG family protein [Methylococcaceae bacterium]